MLKVGGAKVVPVLYFTGPRVAPAWSPRGPREDRSRQLQDLAAGDEETGVPHDADAAMLLRRLKIYKFSKRMPKVAREASVPFCARCFAQLVLTQAGEI